MRLILELIHSIFINGTISAGDYARFERIVRTSQKIPNSVSLRSPGGNVFEALKIGRVIRSLYLQTNAPSIGSISCPDDPRESVRVQARVSLFGRVECCDPGMC